MLEATDHPEWCALVLDAHESRANKRARVGLFAGLEGGVDPQCCSTYIPSCFPPLIGALAMRQAACS